MGYEAGIEVLEQEQREAVSAYYKSRHMDFDADYVLSSHIAGVVFGYAFATLATELSARKIRDLETEDGELVIVPLTALKEYTDAYRAFLSTRGGKRMDACCALDVEYEIGNVTTAAEYSNETIYVSPEDAIEAYKALASTGHGDTLRGFLDNGVINQLEELADVVDVLDGIGCEEVGWPAE